MGGGPYERVEFGAFPYYLNARTYTAASGVTAGNLTGIHALLQALGCAFLVDGTSDNADNGTVADKYINSTHELKIISSNLHLYDVSGCFGLMDSGDNLTITGTYSISPPRTITSS